MACAHRAAEKGERKNKRMKYISSPGKETERVRKRDDDRQTDR